jgi:hypothetical protein
MTIFNRIFLLAGLCLTLICSCKKNSDRATTPPTGPNTPPGAGFALTYVDSLFYLHTQTSDYTVSPTSGGTGQYFGFPDGLQIDGNSGDIDVSKSETGLRYRVSFVPKSNSTDTFTTMITISGINFLDGFYNLANGDSIAYPIYNGWSANAIPGLNNGSLFDEGSTCNKQGCTINMGSGQINLAQTVRNGVFGAVPQSNSRQEFLMSYRINDNSQEALNSIDIKIYYFATMADVSQEVYDIISSREGTILGASLNPALLLQQRTAATIATASTNAVAGSAVKPAKPRPPCIFIVGR